ncbi:MAG: RelA/SpoT family protein [SAR324 cluster bacterium]|nr:RelA/SpoT family protein [SAR324 cluster bacterium]
MIRIDDLIAKVADYAPQNADLGIISKAYVYSARLHKDKFSPGGNLVLQHALEVSTILADFRLDIPCIVAGLLHDVLAEQLADPESIQEMVGSDVAGLVVELSSISKASFQGSVATRAEHMRQMILASTRELRVILILLADRLQLLRTAKSLSSKDRTAAAREVLAIYGPIAHRLGVHFFKSELEDLAFQILEPKAYGGLRQMVDRRVSKSIARIDQINGELSSLLDVHSMAGEVLGRTKNLYSIHHKMRRDKIGLDQIYDLLATRIIVEKQEDCYRMLGLIHAGYTPLPGKFKDYIALPKPNGYQSLHTCVFGAAGDIIEIQIRTQDMNRQAEMGVAAHFIYKDGVLADERELANVSWFRRLLLNLQDGQDPQESMELLTQELESDQIFVFTPAGEVIMLPKGATPIDFAYAIHSEVGHRCSGAKMNDRMISIRTPLENGSVVKIITSSRQTPNKDWLKHAVSSKALARIRNHLRNEERIEAIRLGKDKVARESRRFVKKPEDLPKLENFREWMHRHGLNTLEEVYAAVGAHRVNFQVALERTFPEPEPETPPAAPAPRPRKVRRKRSPGQLVSISGLDNLVVRFAKCCAPVYGDPVKGIITRGRGISIHRPDCHNISEQVYLEKRLVDAEWVETNGDMNPVRLAVHATTSISDLTSLIDELEQENIAPITPGRITAKQGVYTQRLTLMVGNAKQVERIITRLNARKGIRAERILETA